MMVRTVFPAGEFWLDAQSGKRQVPNAQDRRGDPIDPLQQ